MVWGVSTDPKLGSKVKVQIKEEEIAIKDTIKMASQVFEFHMEMTCEGCANAAKRVLGKKGDAVSNIETDVDGKKVTVTSTLSSDELLEALQKTGKAVSFKGVKM